MQKRFVLAAAAAALIGAGEAGASTIVHDSVAEFHSITAVQGLQANGLPVAADRSVIGKMFDNGLGADSIYSPGIGGRISFVIAPTTNVLTSGAVIELTNAMSGHQEQAQIYLGVDDASYILIGNVLNAEFAGGASVVNLNPAIATLGLVSSGVNSSFTLSIVSGAYNSLRIVDISSPAGGGNRDGFDIAELEVTSMPPRPVVGVPAPAGLAVFGVGLLGFAALRRRDPAA
jgi:hypothetical protein